MVDRVLTPALAATATLTKTSASAATATAVSTTATTARRHKQPATRQRGQQDRNNSGFYDVIQLHYSALNSTTMGYPSIGALIPKPFAALADFYLT